MIECKMCNKRVPARYSSVWCTNCGHIFTEEERNNIIHVGEYSEGNYSYSEFGDSSDEYSNYNE